MGMNYKDLGRRIRSLRQKQHLTQEQLAYWKQKYQKAMEILSE